MAIFCSRRASARSFSMCLNSSKVVEPMTRSSPAVRIGLISVARSIVPPVTAPAPTVEWISSMKRIAFGRAAQRLDHRLEALLEVAAEARAGEQRAGVEREDLGVLQRVLHVVAEQPRGEALGHRGLADAGLADEHRIVLAPPAQDFDGALQLVGAADQRIEQPCARPLGQVDAVGRQRIARGRRFVALRPPPPAALAAAARRVSGVLAMPCEMNSSTSSRVMPCSARAGAPRGSSAAAGSPRDVAGLHFLPLRALHVQHRGLEHAAERRRLFRLALLAARQLLDRFVEVRRRVPGAAARGRRRRRARIRSPSVIVQQRVEQVFEREVGVPARDRFADRRWGGRFRRRRRNI